MKKRFRSGVYYCRVSDDLKIITDIKENIDIDEFFSSITLENQNGVYYNVYVFNITLERLIYLGPL